MGAAKKIRFIEPCGRFGRPFSPWVRQWPLLGPITLATMLEEKGYDAGVYNENVSGPLGENAEAYADVCEAAVVGISIMTPTANRGYEIAGMIRRDNPGARIVFGGVHATFRPEEALAYGDIVVKGEGENVIEAIADGRITSGIIEGPVVEDLDSLPTLNHRVMRDFDKLVGEAMRKELYPLSVATSRGCPYGCSFCSVTKMFGAKLRQQSVGKVRADLEKYLDRGFRRFFFYDDNFTADRARTREIVGCLGGADVRFNAQTRIDFAWADRGRKKLDKELLGAMQRAGGNVLYIGYETIDEATAGAWKKGYKGESGGLTQRLAEDTRILHDHGFWIHGMFVLGSDHGEDDAGNVVEFAKENGIESLQMSVLTPFPGTPLFEEMKPRLVFNNYPGDWDYYDGGHCVFDGKRMSIEEVQRVILDSHKRFYRGGGMNWRRLRLFMKDKLTIGEKMRWAWKNAGIARSVMKEWREESETFLREVAQRRSLGGTKQFKM